MAKKTLQRISVNEQLLNKYTRHAVFLQQLEKGEALRIGRFMKQNVFPSIFQKLMTELGKVKDIKTVGSARRIKRLNQMLASVKQTAIAGFVRAEKQAISRLVDVSRFEAQWNINTIERTVPLDISMVMPSNAVLRTLVTTKAFGGPDNQHKLDTWFKGLSTSVRNNINKQLRVGIAAGESVPALGKRVQKAFNTGTKQAQAIARTMTSAVVHNAREEVFKANKKIVPKVQYQATLDDRTTVVCINLDGKVFETGKGPRPPIHFQCRSTVVPITPSWQEFGVSDPPPATRASMNGAVPAKLTYKKWFAQQSKATQVKVLGKKKAELFRSGRVKIEKFSSKDLKPLTLKQIARREGVVFEPSLRTIDISELRTDINKFQELQRAMDKPGLSKSKFKVLAAKAKPIRDRLKSAGMTSQEIVDGKLSPNRPASPTSPVNVSPSTTTASASRIGTKSDFSTNFEKFKKQLANEIDVDLGILDVSKKGAGFDAAVKKFKLAVSAPVTNRGSLSTYRDKISYTSTFSGGRESIIKSAKKQVNKFLGRFEELGSKEYISKINNTSFNGIEIGKTRGGGAFVKGNKLFSPDAGSRRMWHEMGHIIENTDSSLLPKLKQWMINRSGNQTISLDYLGKSGVSAYKGNFIDAYVGRIYSSGHTEILSMGLEQFTSYERMIKFAKKDFDHFSLIMGVLRNAI